MSVDAKISDIPKGLACVSTMSLSHLEAHENNPKVSQDSSLMSSTGNLADAGGKWKVVSDAGPK